MIRTILAALAAIWPLAASAHVGHLAEVAGHGHWIGLAAAGAAAAVAAWAGTRGKAAKPEDDAETEDGDTEPQEA